MGTYYFDKNGQKIGPVAKDELIRLAETGVVNEQTVFVVDGRDIRGRHIKNLRPIFERRNGVKPVGAAELIDESSVRVPPKIEDEPVSVPEERVAFAGLEEDFRNSFVKKYQDLKSERQARPHAKPWGCLVVMFLINIILLAVLGCFVLLYLKGELPQQAAPKAAKTESTSFAKRTSETMKAEPGMPAGTQTDLSGESNGPDTGGDREIEGGFSAAVGDIEETAADGGDAVSNEEEQAAEDTAERNRKIDNAKSYYRHIVEIDKNITEIGLLCDEIELKRKRVVELLKKTEMNFRYSQSLMQKYSPSGSYRTREEYEVQKDLKAEIDQLRAESDRISEEMDRLIMERKRKSVEKDQLVDECLDLADQAMNLDFDSEMLTERERGQTDDIFNRSLKSASDFVSMSPDVEKLLKLKEAIEKLAGRDSTVQE